MNSERIDKQISQVFPYDCMSFILLSIRSYIVVTDFVCVCVCAVKVIVLLRNMSTWQKAAF
jgi:hypothetical protein